LLSSKLATVGFAIFLTLAAYRAYQYPGYTSDMFLYMANAVAMHGDDIKAIHDTVYQEVLTEIPKPALDHLLGNDPVETSQSRSFHERAVNPYRFAEFLPCFAVRPVFNELVYVLHYKLGIGLLRATVLISVASYWVLGWIVFTWISRYVAEPWAALVSTLLMLTPPIWDLARWPMPDALSCLVLLSGLYALLEMKRVVLGLTILMASVYIRTDNVLLVLSVLAYLSILNHTIEKAKAAVLAALAIGSVFVINHFAGDYGARLLYYRAFIAPPVAPGELVAHFGFHDYVVALRAGVAEVLHGDFIAFALMGVVGLLKRPTSAILGLVIVTVAYSTSRFVIFPLVEGRYFGLFFLVMGISLVSTLLARHAPPLRQTASALNIAREPVER
jgi:hypothetical protein